ncbi:Uncharacterized protein Fot_18746 [Forsythia ovata]|uniref:Uncharacterized protein n=1 Tax=Forsythia ovata TaxID=205694 RepID=A0ABD1VJ21_9LAMI
MEEDSYEPNVEILKDGYLALRTTLEGKARIENDVHAPLSYARDLIDGFCIGVQMATGNSEAINKENYLFPLLANDVEGKMRLQAPTAYVVVGLIKFTKLPLCSP